MLPGILPCLLRHYGHRGWGIYQACRCPREFGCRGQRLGGLGDLVKIVVVVGFGVVNGCKDLGNLITPILQLLVD